uniref:uncharacterized protein LOC120345836 isoform X1 n=1 Tax=Styela clava TaxID=7725 RepID=UPI001939F54E|nr:uncharacterized protein LOC120345836 isoform X1 [Styela clava]
MFTTPIFCVALTCVVVLAEAGFAPSDSEEFKLTRCLLHKTREHRCTRILRAFRAQRVKHEFCKNKISGAISEDERTVFSSPTSEYICALSEYQNTERSNQDVMNSTLNVGSCNRIFSSMRKTWKQFFAQRDYESRVQNPMMKRRNGSRILARFSAGVIADRFNLGNLKAADLIISRSASEDIEVFGKYAVTVTFRTTDHGYNGDVIVHNTLQATCPSAGNRFFVAGINQKGIQKISSYTPDQHDFFEFEIEVSSQKQIVKVDADSYLEQQFDIGLEVSGLVLHMTSTRAILPLRNVNIDRTSRSKRSLSSNSETESCRRKPYSMDYRNNDAVIRPYEIDIGECVGSCDKAFLLDLNSTNHALSMHSERRNKKKDSRNPQPTVCCAPISYRKLHYITLDERGSLMSAYVDNMITEYCGCI